MFCVNNTYYILSVFYINAPIRGRFIIPIITEIILMKNLLQDLEAKKKKFNAEGKYKEAKEIQKKLDFYYYGIIS